MLLGESLTRRFRGVVAVDDVTIDLPAGSTCGLIGPNGSGKSTLFNLLSGVLAPDGGRVVLDGATLPPGDPARAAAAGLIRTFQIPRMARRMTVLEHLLLAQGPSPDESLRRLFQPGQARRIREVRAERLDECRQMVATLGLVAVADDDAGTLSGGQRKLLTLGMALLARPRVLLLDEPVAGVNQVLVERIVEVLADRRRAGLTVLLIEHHLEMVAELCERVWVLDAGRVIACGTPDEVRGDPAVAEAYLGAREAHR